MGRYTLLKDLSIEELKIRRIKIIKKISKLKRILRDNHRWQLRLRECYNQIDICDIRATSNDEKRSIAKNKGSYIKSGVYAALTESKVTMRLYDFEAKLEAIADAINYRKTLGEF